MVVNNNLDNRCSALESFRSNRPKPEVKPDVKPQVEVSQPAEADKVEVSKPQEQTAPPVAAEPETAPKQKHSFFQKCKDLYASFKKGMVTGWEYTVGTAKGLLYGGIAACSVLGGDAIINAVKNLKAGKLAEAAAESAPKIAKTFSTKGKVIAGIVGAAVMAYQLFQAHLNSNEKCADIDHRWGTGHNK